MKSQKDAAAKIPSGNRKHLAELGSAAKATRELLDAQEPSAGRPFKCVHVTTSMTRSTLFFIVSALL